VILPGITIQYHRTYPRQQTVKTMLKIVVPGIPVIPAILYILLLLLCLLDHDVLYILLLLLCLLDHDAIRQYKQCILYPELFQKKFITIVNTYMTASLQILRIQILYNGNSWKQMITEVMKW
jgi:hypothetical protein